MGRIIAIDYGKKRCGLATTDPLQLSINTLEWKPQHQLMPFLSSYLQTEDVDVVVFGKSVHQDGTPNEIHEEVIRFAERLRKEYPALQIAFQDEYRSSKDASQAMVRLGYGKKKRADKGKLDSVSAGIILERYLYDNSIW